MQPQYSQGTAPSHHPPPYAPPEVSGNGGSVTSSLRQWRKKDYLEKKSTEENSPPVNENPSHIARVAPHTYYPRPPDDQCNYQHQYGDYSLSYKPAAPVKYSEIVENQQATQTIENITPVIQKHKEKEYVELCSVAPQSHLKQFQDHIPMKQSTYMEPPFSHQYIPKDSQIHSFLQKQSQMPQYIQKEPYQQFLSKYNMQSQYPPPYSSEPNNFLAHLNKINPRMAQSIINDTHLRESQVPVYHNLEHSRSYPQPQRMYHPSSMPPNPAHPPRNLPPSYNYSQSYNYNVKPNIPPVDPYNRPYQHNMSKYLPEQPLPNISPQHLYNESMHMNYGPYPPKLSPNYSHLEYAQHYQHRRQFPQEYYTHPSYKDSFGPNTQLSPEDLGSESAGPRKPSLKQYLETWVEENISGNLPEMVTPSALADMENLQQLKTALQAKTGDTQDQPLYVLDTTEITNDNLPQFLHLQQFEKLPENIRGYYHSTNSTSRQVIIENKIPNDKLDSCSSKLLTKPLSENCSMVATVETERVTEREESSSKSLENKVVEIHILEDSEAAEEISDGSSLMLNAQRSEQHDNRDDSVIKMCTRLQEDDSNHSRDSLKSMPDIDCNGQTVIDAVKGASPRPQLNLDRETDDFCEGASVDEPVDLVMTNTNISETLRENVEPEDATTTSGNPVVVQRSEITKEISVDESVAEVSNVEENTISIAELAEPPDINYEHPGADVSSLDKFLEEIGFEGSPSPKDQISEPEILNNTQQLGCEAEAEEDEIQISECVRELKDKESDQSRSILEVTHGVSEQSMVENEDIPPVPQVEVTHSVSEPLMPENEDIPSVPQVEVTHTISEPSMPQNDDILPVPQVQVTHSVSEQAMLQKEEIPSVPEVQVTDSVSEQPENEDIAPVQVTHGVSEQSMSKNEYVPPVPQVQVTHGVSERSIPEDENIPRVPQVEVTHGISERSMPKNEDIPRVPQVEVIHGVSERSTVKNKHIPRVKDSGATKNVVNMKNGRKRDRKKDFYKKEKMRKKKRVEYEHDLGRSEAGQEKEAIEEVFGEQIPKEMECVDLPGVTLPEDIPEAMEDILEEMPVLEKATFDENETNIVYHINDSNVILQIADELLEINITTQNGKKLILVKTFSDAVIMNNNEENCPILEDQTVVQPKSVVPPVEHPVMDNYANVTVDNVEMYVKEICEGPDIPIENDVCVFNEEVVSSSTEVESVPEQAPPPPECATEEKKVAKKKSAKKKTVTWLDQTVPENVPKRCLDTKTPSLKIPKTKAALKLIEPHNSKINKDHCVPSKTKNNTIADKISKLKKPRIDNKLKHQKHNKPKKSESHHPKNIPKTKERVIKQTTPKKSETFRHSRKSKIFCKTPVNIDSLYRMSIEPENLAKIKKGLEMTKPQSEKVKEIKPPPEEPRLPLISVQENSITSSTCQDSQEATQRERANKLIQQINDDWEDDDDNNKTVENNIRRLSLQEYNSRKRTSSLTESDDKKYNLENPDLTSNLLGNIRRRTPPKSPELSVKFINKTYSRTSSLERVNNESSPSRRGEESLSSSIELQLPKRSRVLPTPNYNQEYLKKALMNDLQTVNQITTTLIKENQELMHRFLEQQRLTVTELKKVKQIIRYKRLVQHLTTMKVKETEPNNNTMVPSPINPSRTDDNNLKKNILEKRRKKRFRFLYSDDDFDEDLRNSSPIIVNDSCLKRSCVVDNLVPDYSVHQRNSQGQLTLVFKRNVKSDPRMQPFVKLERLPSLDRLALQL